MRDFLTNSNRVLLVHLHYECCVIIILDKVADRDDTNSVTYETSLAILVRPASSRIN